MPSGPYADHFQLPCLKTEAMVSKG
jgi:hypothetical protein